MKNILLLMGIALLSLVAVARVTAAPPIIQFRLVVDNPTADSEPMTVVQPNNSPKQPQPEVLNVQKEVLLDHTAVKSATVEVDPLGNTVIGIKFTNDGAKRFAEVTRENVRKRLAIVIDGKLYSAPHIMSEITGGNAAISGKFTKEEAENLAARINGSPTGSWLTNTKIISGVVALLFVVAVGVVSLILIFRKHTPPAA